MLSDVNRNPRRWVDESGRVRVIEGWHPSEPSDVRYNLKVDGEWVGTFESLHSAVREATAALDIDDCHLVLVSDPDLGGPQGHQVTGLHLVPPVEDA